MDSGDGSAGTTSAQPLLTPRWEGWAGEQHLLPGPNATGLKIKAGNKTHPEQVRGLDAGRCDSNPKPSLRHVTRALVLDLLHPRVF